MGGRSSPEAFSHEVLVYAGLSDLTDRAAAFVREGLDQGEAVMVMVVGPKITPMREKLGADAEQVDFVDMEIVGRNPACIIPAWQAFYSEPRLRPARGIDEPIWCGRSDPELLECQLHEALINLAFSGARGRLLCPYDSEALEPQVIGEARRCHPLINQSPAVAVNGACEQRCWLHARFQEPLGEPARAAHTVGFDRATVTAVRRVVSEKAAASGLRPERADVAALAAHEVAVNSVRHGGGTGTIRMWSESDALVVEVWDAGLITDPLVGLRQPRPESDGGRGLWLVNHLTDLSQVRTDDTGTTVRFTVSA